MPAYLLVFGSGELNAKCIKLSDSDFSIPAADRLFSEFGSYLECLKSVFCSFSKMSLRSAFVKEKIQF